jgi:accessory Sec system S-layer assembly protein
MFSFFRKKNDKIQKLGGESVVDSKSVIGENSNVAATDRHVHTSLSFHPNAKIGTEERYYFQFLNNELPPLKPNQISLSGIEIKQEVGMWHVVAFVRNGLEKAVRFEDLPLVLVGPDGKTLGRKVFPLSDLGEIPAESSRPWIFVFQQTDLEVTEIPNEGWTLSFETKPKHQLDLEESWEKNLSPQDKEGLLRLVYSLEPPKLGEINITGINAEQFENGDLHVTILIRNGHPHDIQIESLILYLEDASGEVVAKGGFKLNPLNVKADTSKPWALIFSKNFVVKDSVDLSTWKVYPAQ